MSESFQNVATLLIVAGAVAYLCRRWRSLVSKKKATGCGTCSSCPIGDRRGTPTPEVISIGLPIEGLASITSPPPGSVEAGRPIGATVPDSRSHSAEDLPRAPSLEADRHAC